MVNEDYVLDRERDHKRAILTCLRALIRIVENDPGHAYYIAKPAVDSLRDDGFTIESLERELSE